MTAPRAIRAIRARTRTAVDGALHRIELRRGAELKPQLERAPVFIVGAPRSGTTLLYQVLTDQLDVGYLANAHCAWPGGASIVERRQRPRDQRGPATWQSEHGATREPWEPSECGPYWYRFVPTRPHQLTDEDATAERLRAVRSAVRLLARECGRPVVFKNVLCSLRLPLLARALPEARFVHITRDLESNARSLLAGRIRRGDPDAWWSAEPAGYEALVAVGDPAASCAWQVRRVTETVSEELARLAPGRAANVTYEALCGDPAGQLDRIRAALAETGVPLDLRAGRAELPPSFRPGGGAPLPPDLEQALARATSKGGP